jgi:hypothetical protein
MPLLFFRYAGYGRALSAVRIGTVSPGAVTCRVSASAHAAKDSRGHSIAARVLIAHRAAHRPRPHTVAIPAAAAVRLTTDITEVPLSH